MLSTIKGDSLPLSRYQIIIIGLLPIEYYNLYLGTIYLSVAVGYCEVNIEISNEHIVKLLEKIIDGKILFI